MLSFLTRTINDKFGSKQGMLKAIYYRCLTIVGSYKSYKQVDWLHVQRVVVICHGNICRSPLGSELVRNNGVDAVSSGVSCTDNHPADPRAITFASKHNLDLTNHLTTSFKNFQPQKGDLLVVMEPVHLLGIGFCNKDNVQVTLAGLWLLVPNAYIHDPYNTSPIFFERCQTMVLNSMSSIVRKIREVPK